MRETRDNNGLNSRAFSRKSLSNRSAAQGSSSSWKAIVCTLTNSREVTSIFSIFMDYNNQYFTGSLNLKFKQYPNMYPRKTSFSKKTINSQHQPKFILKPVDETIDQMNTSYLEIHQNTKSNLNNNAGQRLQQILQKQINQTHKNNKSVDEDRLNRQQFINRSQQVVRQEMRSSNKHLDPTTPNHNVSYEEFDLREENRVLKQQVRKLQLELQQSKHQNHLLIADFEQLRDQLERQSEEFNQAFDLINEEKQLIQQEIDQKDQIISQLRIQLNQPSKTQQQIDEIKNRILARKSQHRSSRENIQSVLQDMDQSARQELKENIMDFQNRYPSRSIKLNQ